MKKINFQDNVTKANAETMNLFQSNIEEGINSVVESGSNENGSWIKYSDGTMICTKSISISGIPIDVPWGVLYESTEIKLGDIAQAFTDYPIVTISNVGSNGAFFEFIKNVTPTSFGTTYLVRPTTFTSWSGTLNMIAIGHWK